MEIETILILVWALIMTVTLGILVVFLLNLRKKHEADIHSMEESFAKTMKKSTEGQRSGVKGKVWEQMAPLFPEFTSKYEASDARFLGSPIDYVIFKNMSKFDKKTKDENPIEVVLVEIKTGKNKQLTDLEKAIGEAVDANRVSFDQINLPDEKTE